MCDIVDKRLKEFAENTFRLEENEGEDKVVSLADAISFAWLKEAGLSDTFSYDRHFVTAGFNLVTK